MQIKDKSWIHVVEQTCVVEKSVGGAEVTNIHELNALQRTNIAITAK